MNIWLLFLYVNANGSINPASALRVNGAKVPDMTVDELFRLYQDLVNGGKLPIIVPDQVEPGRDIHIITWES